MDCWGDALTVFLALWRPHWLAQDERCHCVALCYSSAPVLFSHVRWLQQRELQELEQQVSAISFPPLFLHVQIRHQIVSDRFIENERDIRTKASLV